MIEKIHELFRSGTKKEQDGAQKNTGKFRELEDNLGYTFSDISLLEKALRHKSSIKTDDDPQGIDSNERLEFLGDAVVNCLVTEELYRRFPRKSEGQLSKYKSLLVSRKILGKIADRISLGTFIQTGKSEKRDRRGRINSIASNAFEAVIGAAYLDGGIDAVRDVFRNILFPSIDHFIHDVEHRNYKSRILELAQADKLGTPTYVTISEKGPQHRKKFTVAVEVQGVRLGEGLGKSKKEAQQEAARIAIPRYTPEFVRELHSKKE
ncbi:MAG: ribonuclease III [Fibrobacterota bacterium]